MTILQKPETINLSGNLADFILSSSSAVSFILKQDTRVLFEGNYTPNDNQRIEIDIKDIIEADLKAVFSDLSEPYEQSELAKTYTAEIAGQTHTFTVIKAGVDRLATSAANFLRANWLTWQPQVKKVTYYLPESLTFYSVEASVVKVKAYFQQPDGGYSEETKQLLSIVAGRAYTVPVQYAVIAGKFESRLPAFYDVWFETVDGVRLSYIQRYVSSGIMSEDESWIVFENSLGGFDTFRAYGQESLTADHDHQLAKIGDITDEYNVDTTREFQKNTGYLADHERKWLLDFFPSRQKYLYSSNYLRRIVVTEDDTSYTGNELPSSYTFNYRFADAKPYLNLQRVEELPSDLTISIPDLSSFTIPPRLVEFPSQNLTEGVLFPVQNPYSESWATTTIGAILSYIMNKIIETGGDGTGGVGHTHGNYEVLKALEYLDGYLTVNGKKIKAGFADEAGKLSEEHDIYIHKDREDFTNFLLKLLGGLIVTDIKSDDFLLGALGTGYGLLKKDSTGKSYFEVDKLFVRLKAIFAELEVMELTYSGGNFIFGPAGARCTKVEEYDTYYRCYFTADDGNKKVKNKFRVDDQVQCRESNINEGVHENVSNKYYWRLCVGIGDDYIDLSKSVRDMASDDSPAEGDSMVTVGNQKDVSRQNVIIISVYGEGSPSIIRYQGINSFSLNGKAIKTEYYDATTGRYKEITYGDNYNGAPDRTSFFEYIDGEGLKVKGAVDVQPGSGGWKNFTGLSDSIQVAVDAAGNALDKANQAQSDADDAKQDAADAAGRLDEWASDSVISPTEKLALKQEIANLQSEYDTNIANAGKYALSTTAYTNAWNAYKAELEYHSADTPENITIRPAFKTSQATFYTERETLLTAIAAAAKEYADKLLESLSVGAENLLLNTGFTGEYVPRELASSTNLNSVTKMYSDPLIHWSGAATVISESASMSGYAAKLGSLSQNVTLIKAEKYTASVKAKGGSLTFGLNSDVVTFQTTSEYKVYSYQFTGETSSVFKISGSATVCEVKLERGTVRTDWCPSRKDKYALADEFKKYWYLMDALEGATGIYGGLILTSMIQLGKYTDGILEKVKAGISGIYNDDTDVAFWAGGTFEQAIATIQKIVISGENPTSVEWKNLAKFVATHGGDLVLRGLIYATGGIFDNIIINSARAHDNSFVITKDGVTLTGDVQTGINGERIVISARDKSLTMYSADNIEVASLKFAVGESGGKIARFKLQYFTSEGKMGETEIGSYYLQVHNVVGGVTRRLFITAAQISYWDGSQEYRGYTGQDGDKYYINGILFKKVT